MPLKKASELPEQELELPKALDILRGIAKWHLEDLRSLVTREVRWALSLPVLKGRASEHRESLLLFLLGAYFEMIDSTEERLEEYNQKIEAVQTYQQAKDLLALLDTCTPKSRLADVHAALTAKDASLIFGFDMSAPQFSKILKEESARGLIIRARPEPPRKDFLGRLSKLDKKTDPPITLTRRGFGAALRYSLDPTRTHKKAPKIVKEALAACRALLTSEES